MRLDPTKDLNAQIVAAARRTRVPAPTPAPPAPSGPGAVDNGAGAAPPPRAPLTMTEQILRAAGRRR